MKLALALVALLAWRSAHAGPYCGAAETFAPAADSVLPIAPTIALHVEDMYYGGKRQHAARPPVLRATIDGKRVTLTTRDVRTTDGVIRFIKIKSRATGALEIRAKNREELVASYTIEKDWTASEPTITVSQTADRRLGPYRYIGHAVALRVDVPAIAFKLRWRRDAKSSWRAVTLPANVNAETTRGDVGGWKRQPWWGSSEAWVGQRMCGMVANVPVALLERTDGVEATLTATLPDGTEVAVTNGMPASVVLVKDTSRDRPAPATRPE